MHPSPRNADGILGEHDPVNESTAPIPNHDKKRLGRGAGAASGLPDSPPLLTPLRELQLVEAHQKGDPEALGTLLKSYQRRIYAVCDRMVRHAEEARDLTQESMIKVIEGLESFDARAKVSTWIIRVTMNCCISHLRKRKLRSHLSLDIPATGSSDPDAGPIGAQLPEQVEPQPEQRVEQEESRGLVIRALGVIDPQMRAVLVLRDMHDLDYQQIAEVIESPVGTVKSRLFRARAALRDAIETLESEGQEDSMNGNDRTTP